MIQYAQAAISLAVALNGNSVAKAQARAQAAQAKAQEAINKGQATQQNAEAALANHMVMLGNKRITNKLEKAKATLQTNALRQRDAGVQQSFVQGIQNAEALGAAQAYMASTDTGGSSMEAVETAMRLQQAMGEQALTKQREQLDYDAVMAVSGLQTDMLQSLDMTVHQGSRNVTLPVYHQQQYTGGVLGAIAGSGIMNLAGSASGSFGAKQPSTGSANLPSSYGMKSPSNGFWSSSGSAMKL